MSKTPATAFSVIAAVCLFALSACSTSTPQPPAVSHDGLVLVPDTTFQQVYRKPGANIVEYRELGIAPCKVSFKKNWLRDQNSVRINLSNRVTQRDVDRIKDRLSEACGEQFRAALEKDPAYKLVDNFDDGEHVLVLHPSIINLDITAPEIQSTSRNYSYTTSAGEMTLVLELSDATTGETLARVIDKWRDREDTYLEWANDVTNTANANRILKRWAMKLREGLDEARSQ